MSGSFLFDPEPAQDPGVDTNRSQLFCSTFLGIYEDLADQPAPDDGQGLDFTQTRRRGNWDAVPPLDDGQGLDLTQTRRRESWDAVPPSEQRDTLRSPSEPVHFHNVGIHQSWDPAAQGVLPIPIIPTVVPFETTYLDEQQFPSHHSEDYPRSIGFHGQDGSFPEYPQFHMTSPMGGQVDDRHRIASLAAAGPEITQSQAIGMVDESLAYLPLNGPSSNDSFESLHDQHLHPNWTVIPDQMLPQTTRGPLGLDVDGQFFLNFRWNSALLLPRGDTWMPMSW